jgi:hypothetical protein
VKQAAHEYALLPVIACRFKVFFLLHFRVSEMVEGSPLGRTVSRKLMAIGHAEFRPTAADGESSGAWLSSGLRTWHACLFA